MERKQFGVFIGRFQPIHLSHLEIIKSSLKMVNHLIIVVGSYRTSIDERNPFSFEVRSKLIFDSIPKELQSCVSVIPYRDTIYDIDAWIVGLQNIVRQISSESQSILLVGHYKDDSSFYLKMFPQWEFYNFKNLSNINGSKIRENIFENKCELNKEFVSPHVYNFLLEWNQTQEFKDIQIDYIYNKSERERKLSGKYPITDQTCDAVVIQSGHVLLVERGHNPGKGKYALPGGHVGQDEFVLDAAIRELKEETKIQIDKRILKDKCVGEKRFDHPLRSRRGRVITTAFCFRLDPGGLPVVKGADDAVRAFWMPLSECILHEENFFEDHIHIIQYFISRGNK